MILDSLDPIQAIAPLALAAIGAAPQLLLGAYKAYRGNKAMKDLEKEGFPEQTIDPEILESQKRAERMAKAGFTPEETAAFTMRQQRLANQKYRMATQQAGGSLAGAIQAGINFGDTAADVDFAARDAAMRRTNIRYADTLNQYLQGTRNAIQANKQQWYKERARAASGTLGTGLNEVAGSFGSFATNTLAGYKYKMDEEK